MIANITNKEDGFISGFDKKQSHIYLSDKFQINPLTQKVNIEAEFKGLPEKTTRFYFGICCFKGDRIITAPLVMRLSKAATIEKVIKDGTLINKKLLVISNETNDLSLDWNINPQNTRSQDYQYSLGFYFDGNVNKLPDDVLFHLNNYSTSIDYGTIRETDSHSITLNIPLPENILNKIQEGTTKIIRHTSSGYYNYPAASNATLTTNWIKKNAEIKGLADFGVRDDFKFWTDTDSFRVFILANYND